MLKIPIFKFQIPIVPLSGVEGRNVKGFDSAQPDKANAISIYKVLEFGIYLKIGI